MDQQKDFMSSVISPGQDQQQNANMFPPFPTNVGALPQSPNNAQLAMGLLNNLMQMQSLDTQSISASSSSNPNTTSFDPQFLEQQIKLTQLQQLQQLQNQIFQQQIALISGQSSAVMPTSPLVNVSRQSSSGGDHYTGLPTPGPSGEIRPQRPSMDFTPTALGNYMEPLPHAYIPTASSTQNNYDTSPNMLQHTRRPLNPSLQRQLQALTGSQHPSPQRQHYHGTHHSQDPTSSPNFQPTSPLHSVPVSPMQHPNVSSSPNTFSGQQHGHTYNAGMSTYSQHRFQTPHSAPESMAFHIYSGPMPGGGSSIPGLNLGPAVDDSYGRGRGPILDQDISPLTSPWLGARPTNGNASISTSNAGPGSSTSSRSGNAGSKRTASSSGDEGGSARKKPSPAIRPTLAMTAVVRKAEEREKERGRGSNSPLGPMGNKSVTSPASSNNRSITEDSHNPPIPSSASGSGSGSVSPDPSSIRTQSNIDDATSTSNTGDGSASGTTRRRPYRGSKSTTSTPLLRSTPSSSLNKGLKSRATASAGGGVYGQTVQDSPSPVDLNVESSIPEDEVSGSGGHDRSMPPPPLPASLPRSNSENGNGDADDGGEANNLDMGGMDAGMDISSLGMEMNLEGAGMNMSNMEMDFNDMMSVVDLNSHIQQHRLGVGGSREGREDGMDMHTNDMNMDMGGMHMGGMNMGQMGMGMSGMGDMSFGTHMNEMEMMAIDFAHGQQHDSSGHDRQGQYHQNQNTSMSSAGGSQMQVQAPLMPVTPASIMNLGRLGISGPSSGNNRLATTSATSTSTSSLNPTNSSTATKSTVAPRKSSRKEALASASKAKESLLGTTTKSGKSSSKKTNPVSSGLKPLLPGSLTSGLDASMTGSPTTPFMNASAGPSSSGPAIGPRKTSHKAAEQKRRDSLKTTFDDLRKLLPPIALPNDADVDPNMITSPLFHPTAPLLPGALPPRGPPKAGGEGPNKGVSKLQLLICGNEYIRLLRARVDRRDDEIEKLRKEVGRLRMVVEEKGEEGAAGGDDLDLEKDLDAVEKTENHRTVNGSKHGLPATNTSSSIVGGDDGMDEGDDEDDD